MSKLPLAKVAAKPARRGTPLLADVRGLILGAREQVARAVDSGLVTYPSEKLQGHRPASKPAQGNALGNGMAYASALKGRKNALSASMIGVVPPLQGLCVLRTNTQGAALGWFVAAPLVLDQAARKKCMKRFRGCLKKVASAILADVEPWLPARRTGVTTNETPVNSERFARRSFFPGGRMPPSTAGKDACRHIFRPALSEQSLRRMVQFAEVFPDRKIVQSLIAQLGWTHFLHIIYLDDELKRDFYAEMCRIEKWSTRTLAKKIGGMLFERTALSKN
jgi:hypothetical protein